MTTLILIRHGQSKWNLKNIFTGWVDVSLSPKGVEEALQAGEEIKDQQIDVIFTSLLIRAEMTAMLAMNSHHSGKVPVIIHTHEPENWTHIYSAKTQADTIPLIRAWELNERMYGELQGLNKEEAAKQYGAEQIHIWRRSFDIPPPGGESLAMTAARTIPYFEGHIIPYLQDGKNVLVVAHGNSLRSIMMKLDHLSADEVLHLELATGVPILYNYSDHLFTKITSI
jgi:2,3-bisphosphoglycerate-dependent phosphoglycerate mutase